MMSRPRHMVGRSCPPTGFTRVELLVTLALAGLLIGLLAPTVELSREAARRQQCRDNLQQLGLALHNYENMHGMLPAGATAGRSWHVALLPFINQQKLYDKVDYSTYVRSSTRFIKDAVIPQFLCPSDTAPPMVVFPPNRGIAATSYLGNSGTGLFDGGLNGLFANFVPHDPDRYRGDGLLKSSEITDGLSQTAAVAEVLHGLINLSHSRLRTTFQTERSYPPSEFAEFKRVCATIPSDPAAAGWRGPPDGHGAVWVAGNIGYSTYNHTLTPQQPSCQNGSSVFAGIYTTGSHHTGLVQVLFADGHVRPVSWSIDGLVWRDMGSRTEFSK
jgi:prepilin-type processing-associated H-X9-DG protein